METARTKGHKNKNGVHHKFDDPEFEAETVFARDNGLPAPRQLPSEKVKQIADALINGSSLERDLPKIVRIAKAERKARSRGVSGCSSKKDGLKFEYGLDCIDLAYDPASYDQDSTDSEAEYDEYSDYVFKYSDSEIRSIVQDYLLNGNKEEALNSLEKFRITNDTMARMVKDLIQLSLEGHSAGGLELGSQLVKELMVLKWLSGSTLVNILEEIVDSLDDLRKDEPKIVEAMSVFLAKLTEDDDWPLSVNMLRFMAAKSLDSGNSIVKQCYEDALTFSGNRVLLQGKCVPSGGHQSLDVLSAQFKMILKEFIHSNDKEIVSIRVKELKVPHFNHEFVYQAGIIALEKMHDKVMTDLAALLKAMYDDGTIFVSCIQKGYEKLYKSLSDLYLDLPAVYSLARRWVDKSLKAEFISDVLAKRCPVRARSRTLSEGPDGKLSCMDEENDENNSVIDAKKELLMNGGVGTINHMQSPIVVNGCQNGMD
ncbi:MA3 domain-containing protein [Ditylenchus destructor]|nr:MA3 domain-containing protein [Ditylenchus destructor]